MCIQVTHAHAAQSWLNVLTRIIGGCPHEHRCLRNSASHLLLLRYFSKIQLVCGRSGVHVRTMQLYSASEHNGIFMSSPFCLQLGMCVKKRPAHDAGRSKNAVVKMRLDISGIIYLERRENKTSLIHIRILVNWSLRYFMLHLQQMLYSHTMNLKEVREYA